MSSRMEHCWRKVARHCSDCAQVVASLHCMTKTSSLSCPKLQIRYRVAEYYLTWMQMHGCLVRLHHLFLFLSQPSMRHHDSLLHSAVHCHSIHIVDCYTSRCHSWDMSVRCMRQSLVARQKWRRSGSCSLAVGSLDFLLGRNNCCIVHIQVP